MDEAEISNATPNDGTKKRKAESTPPDGYVCRLCSVPGHWIQICPMKKTGAKRQRKSDHVPVPGQDPSEEDIEKAKELQAIPPPKCFCGEPSRLNKVKRSKSGGDASRAIGKYFFFCSKKRDDDTQCRFARPVEMELKKMKRICERVKAKPSGDKDKNLPSSEDRKTEQSKSKQICKFFAKNGICKKGSMCEFSHDIQSKKVPGKAPKKQETTAPAIEETESDSSSDDSSSDDSSSDEEE